MSEAEAIRIIYTKSQSITGRYAKRINMSHMLNVLQEFLLSNNYGDLAKEIERQKNER